MQLSVTSSDLTYHGWMRLHARRIPLEGVEAALTWGRQWQGVHCICYRIDRGAIEFARRHKVDLTPYEGITVKCGMDGIVITVFRNRTGRKVWR